MFNQNHLAQFQEEGYVILGNIFDSNLIQNWVRCANILPSDPSKKEVHGNFLETDTEMALRTIANPNILDFAEDIMGPFVQLDGLTLVIWPPAGRMSEMETEISWHRDPFANVPNGSCYQRPLGLNVLTYLQDLDADNGPLRVIPKSHRTHFTIPVYQRTKPHPQETLIYLKKGETIVFHNNLAHTRTPNNSQNTRCYFSVFYNLSWLRSSFNSQGRCSQQIIQWALENNDKRLLRLFGIDDQFEKRTNSGFMSEDRECWREWIKEDRSFFHAYFK